jgi:acyl carrier protein
MTRSQSEVTLTDDERARIKDVVCEVLDVDPEEVTPTGSFTQDIGADSMSLVALGASLERTFDIEIEDEKVDKMDSLEGVIAVVGEALTASR